jgi:hypothetical protein
MAFFAARGPQALEERARLYAAVEQFEKDRIPEAENAAVELNEAVRKKAAEYVRQLRRLAADLRTKEFEASLDADGLLERYRLAAPDREISTVTSKLK